MEHQFTTGDHVKLTRAYDSASKGLTGTVIGREEVGPCRYLIQWDIYHSWAHTLSGRVKQGYGYYVGGSHLTLDSTYKYDPMKIPEYDDDL